MSNKKKYILQASVTISMNIEVEAVDESSAIELAEQSPMMPLCWACAGSHDDCWSTSGELDGEVMDIEVLNQE